MQSPNSFYLGPSPDDPNFRPLKPDLDTRAERSLRHSNRLDRIRGLGKWVAFAGILAMGYGLAHVGSNASEATKSQLDFGKATAIAPAFPNGEKHTSLVPPANFDRAPTGPDWLFFGPGIGLFALGALGYTDAKLRTGASKDRPVDATPFRPSYINPTNVTRTADRYKPERKERGGLMRLLRRKSRKAAPETPQPRPYRRPASGIQPH